MISISLFSVYQKAINIQNQFSIYIFFKNQIHK